MSNLILLQKEISLFIKLIRFKYKVKHYEQTYSHIVVTISALYLYILFLYMEFIKLIKLKILD